MAFHYIVACVVLLCPLICQAGRVQVAGAAMPGQDYDYDNAPGAGPGHKELGDLGDGKPVQMGIKDIFQIPQNTSEEEWNKVQFDNFQKQQYNEYQKEEYARWEKHRFFQWQLEAFRSKQAKKQHDMAEEHNKFLQEEQDAMKVQQEKHHGWLQSLLNDPETRKKIADELADSDL